MGYFTLAAANFHFGTGFALCFAAVDGDGRTDGHAAKPCNQ